jgi:hypothetical protein
MLVIKLLSSNVDLCTGANKHMMVVGPPDRDVGVEIELDPIAYMQLGDAAKRLLDRDVGAQIQQMMPQDSENEALRKEIFANPASTNDVGGMSGPLSLAERELEQQLREMEESAAKEEGRPRSANAAEELLRQVGFYSSETVEAPKDALSDYINETDDSDEGEIESEVEQA